MTDTKPPVCRSRAELTAALRFVCLDADMTVAQAEELLGVCTEFFRVRAAGGLLRQHLDFTQQQLLFTVARLNQYDMYHSIVMAFGEAVLAYGEPQCRDKALVDRTEDGFKAVGVYLAALVPALRREVARLKGYLPLPSPEEITVTDVATVPPVAGKEYFVEHKSGANEHHTWTGQRWRDRHGRTYTFDEMLAMGYFPGAPELTNGTGSSVGQ